jgi:putative heme degradation protein
MSMTVDFQTDVLTTMQPSFASHFVSHRRSHQWDTQKPTRLRTEFLAHLEGFISRGEQMRNIIIFML